MNKPVVSIITVCFNSVKTIEDTIQSVKDQSYPAIQYIVVDGKSTDGTLDVIEKHKSCISIAISEKDNGIYEAMNKGLNRAHGRYVLFLNADDCLAQNNTIETLVNGIKDATALGTSVEIFEGERLKRSYTSSHFKKWMFKFGHQPPHPGFFCTTSFIKELGGFNEKFKIAGDFDLIFRCFSNQRFKWKTDEVVSIKMQAGGLSDGGLKQKISLNKEILYSLRINNTYSNLLFIWSKYLVKIFQYK
jgi:glycosyltransferase involved in cell wall biosynthesis